MPSRTNIWMQMFWAICLFLALVFGTFVIIKYISGVPAGDLVGPYFAFAIPGVAVQLLAKWLRDLENPGSSPKRLAVWWTLTISLFFLAINSAFLYSAMKFRLINPIDAVWVFGMTVIGGTAAVFFAVYKPTLERISARSGQTTPP